MTTSRFRQSTRGACVAAVTILTVGAVVGDASAAGAAPSRHVYPGSLPSFASSKADAGAATGKDVEGEVFLSLRDKAGARALATAVSTPGDAMYGKYLSPSAWITKFAPTQATFDAVKKYLVTSGERIYATPASREYIVFRGPASITPTAFGTALHNYRVDGRLVSAPSTAVSLPASVAGLVDGVTLGDARAGLTRPTYVKAPIAASSSAPRAGTAASTGALPACAAYWKQYTVHVPKFGRTTKATLLPCGDEPAQLRSANHLNKLVNAGHDGSGQTVAIIDAYSSPTILRDTNDYMRAVGSPLLTKFREIDPGPFKDKAACEEPSGWQTEEAIDVQSAHSVAPGANILYVGGFNCGGGLDIALSKILDHRLSTIVSNSYGEPEASAPADDLRGEQNLDIQAAGEGIGLYYSTGDDGDNTDTQPYPTPGFTASSPCVTAVGGISQGLGMTGTPVYQTGWGTTYDIIDNGKYEVPFPGVFYGGAGGGSSAAFAEPAYQRGTVPTRLSGQGGDAARVTPDVSDLADPDTGFDIALRPIVNNSTLATGPLEYLQYGGTSLATPIVAGKMALVQQLIGHTIGFANAALYQARRGSAATFNDIKHVYALGYINGQPNDSLVIGFDHDTSLKTTGGYDDTTGMGTLNVAAIASYLTGSG